MDEDRRIELDRRMPELVQRKLAEIDPLDVGGDDEAGGAQLLHRELGLARRRRGIRQRHRSKQREPLGMSRQRSAERFVEQPMPARRNGARQPIGENVGPHREHLAGDALRRHPVEPRLDRLDQLRKERPHLEPIVEMDGALRRRLDQREPEILRALLEGGDDAVGNVMGVHVDRHSVGCFASGTMMWIRI